MVNNSKYEFLAFVKGYISFTETDFSEKNFLLLIEREVNSLHKYDLMKFASSVVGVTKVY